MARQPRRRKPGAGKTCFGHENHGIAPEIALAERHRAGGGENKKAFPPVKLQSFRGGLIFGYEPRGP
jgi:hypothetical protein